MGAHHVSLLDTDAKSEVGSSLFLHDGLHDRSRIPSVRSVKSLGGLLLEDEAPDHASQRHVGVSLFTTIVGTGVLGMPRAVQEAGVGGFALAMLGVCLFTMFGSYLTYRALEVLRHQDVDDVADVGRSTLGRVGYYIALFVCLFDTWGATIGNIRAVADVLHVVFFPNTSYRVLVPGIVVLVFPLTLREKFSDFRIVSIVAMCAMLCFVLVVTIQGRPVVLAESLAQGQGVLQPWPNVMSATAVLFFAFDFQVNLFPLYREVSCGERRSKVATLMPPTAWAMFAAVVVYALVGVSGYSTYVSTTSGNIMDNMEGLYWLKASFSAAIFFAVPILVHEGINLVLLHILPEGAPKAVPSLLMIGSAAYMAAEMPVYSTFKYVGGTVGIAFSCILPPLFFLGSVRNRLRKGRSLASITRAESEPLLPSPTQPHGQHSPGQTAPVSQYTWDRPRTPLVEPQQSHSFYSTWELWAAGVFLTLGVLAVPGLLLFMDG